MKKNILGLVVALFIFTTAVCWGQNLLQNGSFEIFTADTSATNPNEYWIFPGWTQGGWKNIFLNLA